MMKPTFPFPQMYQWNDSRASRGSISYCIISLRFLDSFQFMSQSIDSLAKTIDKGDFKLLKAGFPNIGENLFEKITRKGFFPYNFLDSFEKFNEAFPPQGPLWYNSLTKSVDFTKEQHAFALGVYNDFKCRNLTTIMVFIYEPTF